jgi:uncharacterized membrane protein YkoI
MDSKLKKGILAGAAVLALGVGGTAIAAGGGGDDDGGKGEDHGEQAITGSALDKASRAALDRVGEGRVTATEQFDEEGYYEVEVTRDDGSQVDVHLDRHFNVLNEHGDDEGED